MSIKIYLSNYRKFNFVLNDAKRRETEIKSYLTTTLTSSNVKLNSL